MLWLTVQAHPNARIDRLELAGNTLRVWVRAPAVDGRANEAIERAIAQAVGLRNRQVRVISGMKSRTKTVELELADVDEFRARLAQSTAG